MQYLDVDSSAGQLFANRLNDNVSDHPFRTRRIKCITCWWTHAVYYNAREYSFSRPPAPPTAFTACCCPVSAPFKYLLVCVSDRVQVLHTYTHGNLPRMTFTLSYSGARNTRVHISSACMSKYTGMFLRFNYNRAPYDNVWGIQAVTADTYTCVFHFLSRCVCSRHRPNKIRTACIDREKPNISM